MCLFYKQRLTMQGKTNKIIKKRDVKQEEQDNSRDLSIPQVQVSLLLKRPAPMTEIDSLIFNFFLLGEMV